MQVRGEADRLIAGSAQGYIGVVMKTMLLKPVVYLQQLKWRAEDGATAVEYALLIGLIAVAIIAAVVFLSGQISNEFRKVGSSLT
jgi:pilus assembly protein Flp/PilA